jgi:phosphoribosylformylglycinamidine synthase
VKKGEVTMDKSVRRIYVEKKKGFDVEAHGLYRDLKENLNIAGLKSVRIINRYDMEGISENEYSAARNIIFSEPPVDTVYDEKIELGKDSRIIAIEYLPGQYDQRADSASQCVQILTEGERPEIKVAKLIVLDGEVSDEEYNKVKEYCINPVECQEAKLEKPLTLDVDAVIPQDVKVLDGFIKMQDGELEGFMSEMGLAMSFEDLKFCQAYFRDTEKRDPTITEIRVIDTYWSDHCRHTTFLTEIKEVEIEKGQYSAAVSAAYKDYIESREYVYKDRTKDLCLMDIATIAMKEFKKRGMLEDLDVSDEINACSIVVNVDVDGQNQEWLVMFKNETHNHPTEIEPFGGAATCLGGAIRDPLSGRSMYTRQCVLQEAVTRGQA